MADGLEIDRASLIKVQDRQMRRALRACRDAIGVTTRDLERDLEKAVAAAVPGGLYRALKSEVFPKRGKIAREPAGTVFLNGGERTRGAFEFFTRPGRITGADALAIPLPAAGSRGRNRFLTPKDWEARTGIKLRLVQRPGRPWLLVADEGTISPRTGTFRKLSGKRAANYERRGITRGATTTPIFVLMPYVAFANRLSVQPFIDAAAVDLGRELVRRLAAD